MILYCFVASPFFMSACNSNTYVPPYRNQPQYLLSGEAVDTSSFNDADPNLIYYLINYDPEDEDSGEYAVALKSTSRSNTGTFDIPESLGNKNVTGIYREGFYRSKYTTINLTQNITVIDYEAFLNSSITTMTIPSSVNQIGDGAFYSCQLLERVRFNNSSRSSSASSSACTCIGSSSPSGSVTYSNLTKIPSFCFFNCKALEELLLPSNIEEVEWDAFNGCISLSSTLAFQNVKTIRARAFQSCRSLSTVYIPAVFFSSNGIMEDHSFNHCDSGLEFHFAGTTETQVSTWVTAHPNWNLYSDVQNLRFSCGPNNRGYFYENGSTYYTDDWIYTTNGHDVTITSYIGNTNTTMISVPDSLPVDSNYYVRRIKTDALDSVKTVIERLYLPKTLKRIENFMFYGFTNLGVIDDNTACVTDEEWLNDEENEGEDLAPRIVLNGITNLEVIGDYGFLSMPRYAEITKLWLPYSLKAIGTRAFGSQRALSNTCDYYEVYGAYPDVHMGKVTDFRWDYDESLSQLEFIGQDAFYKLGQDDLTSALASNTRTNMYDNSGNRHHKLTTVIIPNTFKHTGMTSSEAETYELDFSEPYARGEHAFAGSPLIEKVVFKGSSASESNPAATSTVDGNVSDLVLGVETFAYNPSLRTIVFEERFGRSILFHTCNGKFNEPCIGWTSGKNKNDFNGDSGLQTLVLPNKYTKLRIQHCSFIGNSRGAIYLTDDLDNGNVFGSYGNSSSTFVDVLDDVTIGSTDDLSNIEYWNTIGDESYSTLSGSVVFNGYCFATSSTFNNVASISTITNMYGLDQKMPVYESVHYKDSISGAAFTDSGEASSVSVEVGSGNSNDFVIDSTGKFAFVCTGTNATLTKYLYDKRTSGFSGNAYVPHSINNLSSTACSVNAIGASAFSAAFCDGDYYQSFNDLTTVEVPDTIESIGDYAFMRAYGVTKISSYHVNTGEGDAVATGTSDGNYVMPNSLTSIGKHAFAFCNIQQFLKIPDTCVFYENTVATTYETSVFSNNFSLRKITFGNNAANSTYYETSQYTHNGTSTKYTCALYSKGTTTNANKLLLVLYRDSNDKAKTSSDLSLVNQVGSATQINQFDGQKKTNPILYGAYKMGYWIESLILSNPTLDSDGTTLLIQPLISGIYDRTNEQDKYIYLNQPADDYVTNNVPDLILGTFASGATLNIQPYAFEGCDNFSIFRFPRKTGGIIPEGLFSRIPNTMTIEVPSDATGNNFKVCPEGVLDLTYTDYKKISKNAFKGTSFSKIIAPAVKEFTVGESAFENCSSLTEIDFSNVTETVTLERAAFKGCSSIQKVDFSGPTVKVLIGVSAFENSTIKSNEANPFIWPTTGEVQLGNSAFKGCTFESHKFVLSSLTKTIGENCFENCSTLQEVDANGQLSSLTEIGRFAFQNCTTLNNFHFEKFDHLQYIREKVFYMSNNTNTATICPGGIVNFPASLNKIDRNVFNCTKIEEVYFNSSGAVSLYREAFKNCSALRIVYFNSGYMSQPGTGSYNHFQNCTNLEELWLPSDSFSLGIIINGSYVTGDIKLKIYSHKTLANKGNVTATWREISSENPAPIVYYASETADLATVSNGVYSLLADADDTEFWTYADDSSTARSNVLKLGKALGIDSNTGIIHFENGYTLDTSGTLTNVSTIAINDTSDVVTENNGEYTINDTNKNYWIMIAGDSGPAPLFIGKVESVDSDGTVTFSSGYQLDTNGVLTDSGGNTILLPA